MLGMGLGFRVKTVPLPVPPETKKTRNWLGLADFRVSVVVGAGIRKGFPAVLSATIIYINHTSFTARLGAVLCRS